MSIRAQVLVLALVIAANPAQARFRALVNEPLPQAEMAVPEPTEAPVAPVQANAAGEPEAAAAVVIEEALAVSAAAAETAEATPVAAVPATPADPLVTAASLVPVAMTPAVELPAVNAAAAMAGSFVSALTGADTKPATPLHRFQIRRKASR